MAGECPLPPAIPDWLLRAHRDREGWRWTRIESQRLRASPLWGSSSRMQQRVGHQSDRAVLLSPQFDGYDSNHRF